MAVVVGQAVLGFDAQGPCPLERVRGKVGAGDLFETVDAVRVACDGMDARKSIERHPERQQELDVAPAAARAPHRDRRFAAGQQYARRLERLAMQRALLRDSGHDLPDVARLAFDAVAQDPGGDARLPRDLCGRFECHLRRGDHARVDARQSRIAGFDGLAFAALQ